jgi:hypothetical protein
VVSHQLARQSDSLTFQPANLRQETVLIVSIPAGARLQISYSGNNVPINGPLKESLFLHDLEVQRGAPGRAIAVLNERLAKREIVLAVKPPVNTKARILHDASPDLTRNQRRTLYQLSEEQRAVVQFELTVTDTGQVIEATPVSRNAPRLPRDIAERLRDAAMRYSFEPYLINGKASSFRTTITLELP